jgi:hypothetical protein
MNRRELLAGLALSALAALPGRGVGASQPDSLERSEVDLLILLALDVSRSMDERDRLLLWQGYASAFRDAAVIEAIRSGTLGRTALAVAQWAGVHQHRLTVPWTVIHDAHSSLAFAAAVASQQRIVGVETYITGGLRFCAAELLKAREVIRPLFGSVLDISGDGVDSYAHDPLSAERDKAVAAGITINGLPILGDPEWASHTRTPVGSPTLTRYYEEHVIGGTGAFLVEAHGYRDIGRALVRKLVLEVADGRRRPGPNRVPALAERRRPGPAG